MKVKYFISFNLDMLERDINNWIKANNREFGFNPGVYVQGVQTFWNEKTQKYVATVLYDYLKEV